MYKAQLFTKGQEFGFLPNQIGVKRVSWWFCKNTLFVSINYASRNTTQKYITEFSDIEAKLINTNNVFLASPDNCFDPYLVFNKNCIF